MDLTNKIVVITGANGGLGNDVTKAFLAARARVIGVSRAITDAEFADQRFSSVAVAISSAEEARSLIETIAAKEGRIDGLVHLIGGFAGGKSVADTDDATFDNMIDMNFRSAFHLIRAVVPRMRAQGGGRIIAIGSKAAVEPSPMAGAYAASKAALVSLIRTVARENGDRGITANAVLPGTMDTPANRAADPKADFSKWVQPSQVASLLVHLASDQASQINGAVIPIYGSER
jgi:NAD(P)-dependent dehydrogenase (short-subunit alcohol dehydrogenase family)